MKDAEKIRAFDELGREVRRLFHHLRAAAEQVHAGADINASHRAVLESLYRGGAQTVPEMARARPVARQHIQVLVNHLLELELVEAKLNPAHKRSPFIALTARGKRRFEAMIEREKSAIEALELPSARELAKCAETLRIVRERLAETFEVAEDQ